MKLAILIPTTPDREPQLERLISALDFQIQKLENPKDVQYIILSSKKADGIDPSITTGAKRNDLIELALAEGAEYGAFFDDDDLPGPNYIKHQLAVANSGMDCGTLTGSIYWGDKKGKPFLHNLACKEWWEDSQYYYRCPNHLNAMKLSIVKDFKFKDITVGEDGNWSEDIMRAGVLKTEHVIDEVIYHYFCSPKGSPIETEIYNQIMQ